MNVRSYNEGTSDYSKHKYQCWDFWLKFKLNPFDADLVKRTLRTKSTDPRILDYKKIKHICLERIRQIENNQNIFEKNIYVSKDLFEIMLEDYNLIESDKDIMYAICYESFERKLDYNVIISICDRMIEEEKQ